MRYLALRVFKELEAGIAPIKNGVRYRSQRSPRFPVRIYEQGAIRHRDVVGTHHRWVFGKSEFVRTNISGEYGGRDFRPPPLLLSSLFPPTVPPFLLSPPPTPPHTPPR